MAFHEHITDTLDGPRSFLPFGQEGLIVNTNKNKKKLESRAVPENYVRVLSKDTYLVYRRDRKRFTSIRQDEFILNPEQATGKQTETPTEINKQINKQGQSEKTLSDHANQR